MDIQERVLNAFQQEHREHLEGIRAHLNPWPTIPAESMNEAFRMAHSIKGGARVCDLETVEKLAHYLEHLFAELVHGREVPTSAMRASIDRVLNAIEDYMIAVARKREPVEPLELFDELEMTPTPRPAPSGESAGPDRAAAGEAALPVPRQVAPEGNPPAAEAASPKGAAVPDTLRVSAAHLDRLLQSSSLLLTEAVRQSALEKELRELGLSVRNLQQACDDELTPGLSTLSAPGRRESETSTLDELRRGLAQAARQIRRIRALQQRGAQALRATGEQLESDVRRARMVPVSSIFEAFPKMVRDLAQQEEKLIEFTVSGLDREADRLVLQALKDPVMHALRNAVNHGIESPEERRSAGKPERGQIHLEVEVFGSRMTMQISDDGRGLDLGEIRAKAVERQLLSGAEAERLDEDETLDLLFLPGFSTAGQITHVSGRGMGLSVVKEAANRLQGSAQMEPRPGGGSLLTVATPLSIATHRMLLIRSGGSSFAIPAGAIAGLHRLATSAIRTAEGRSVLLFEDEPVLLATLETAFGHDRARLVAEDGRLHVVLLRVGDRALALAVDAMLRELNLLIHPLPPPAAASPFFSGGVILEDGSVALVLNASTLVERFKGRRLEEPVEAQAGPITRRKPTVLVVDDSFTARTLQKSILETDGYEVQIAVDGKQALAMLQVQPFDAVVTDVQMPGMDGFQLLETMKGHPRLKEIPVVLVTSLSSEEDQARGLSLGADAYIVKQKFDHRHLLDAVQQIVSTDE
ncbi:MAG TPA: response regulator [Chthoniobacteraceae bacterium]|nr:response regulator [Chthoniobacteraceae bacterium]